jgi:hypothetical protein
MNVEGKEIILEHKNIDSSSEKCTISFYIIDLEVYFSKRPFLSKLDEDLSFLIPAEK